MKHKINIKRFVYLVDTLSYRVKFVHTQQQKSKQKFYIFLSYNILWSNTEQHYCCLYP